MVHLDAETGVLLIEGESYPENAAAFYQPVLDWLRRYLRGQRREVVAEIRVRYMNTSSSKCMMTFLDLLDEAHRSNGTVSVNWRYERGNEMARECGLEFGEDLDLPFHLVEE